MISLWNCRSHTVSAWAGAQTEAHFTAATLMVTLECGPLDALEGCPSILYVKAQSNIGSPAGDRGRGWLESTPFLSILQKLGNAEYKILCLSVSCVNLFVDCRLSHAKLSLISQFLSMEEAHCIIYSEMSLLSYQCRWYSRFLMALVNNF